MSKFAAEALCWQWSMTEGMNIMIARPFNHVGPGQSEDLATRAFVRQLGDIHRGVPPPVIEVGDINVTRDFTYVRHVVRAYFALLEHGQRGELYNVWSRTERSVRSMLETLIDLAGIEVVVRRHPARMRPAAQRRAVGDPAKPPAATGLRATTSIRDSRAAVLRFHDVEVRA